MFMRVFKFLFLLAFVFQASVAFAVTDQEMEQARTIAAKWYIRYVNDGSGYLDEINPKTIAELESALKPKEKENIKAFLAIQVPNDYHSWDKEKLVEFWVGAFQDKGLQEKGRGGRIRTRSQINKMSISSPQKTTDSPVTAMATPKPETTVPAEPAVSPDSIALATVGPEEPVLPEDFEEDMSDISVSKANNYTWVYIVALAILVALVLALIVYASKVLKKNGEMGSPYQNSNHSNEEYSALKEKLESTINDKDVEIAMLTKKLESAARKNKELSEKLAALEKEMETLRFAPKEESQYVQKNSRQGFDSKGDMEQEVRRAPLRTIYLGRANSKGIFVRADRTLNVGNSVFILDTTDGFSGTFKVADSPAAWSVALSNPAEYLSAACVTVNPDNASAAEKIVTESSGTAIFEGGCWRVIRKAKIRFE